MIHRPFNKSIVDDHYFIKYSANERLADEIFYYQQIQNFEQKKLFAEFVSNVSNGNVYALKLKRYFFNNFYENLKNKEFDSLIAFNLILKNLDFLHSYVPENLFDCEVDKNINKKILIDKTIKEFQIFTKQSNLWMNHFVNSKYVIINEQKCLHFEEIWPKILNIIKNKFLNAELSLIHGDFCFANILHNPNDNQIIFIDPRGFYNNRGCFGDKAYDYAKLLHSVHGNYEQIIYNDYSLSQNKGKVFLNFKFDFSNFEEFLKNKIDPLLFEKSKLIEGLLFVSMCSRHYDNEEHQFVMYCRGLQILNEIL